MSLGNRDLSSLVMATGWDATELANYRLADGISYASIVSQVNAALGALNSELANDPLWGGLCYFSNEPTVEYRIGASNGMNQHTEYARPDTARASLEGHMLPILKWDRVLGWTWDYLREARSEQVQADVADGIKDVRDRWRIQILTRLLKRGDDSGASKGLGSSGYSPGFATTAAQTAVDFTPPASGGTAFASTHEHYVGIAGGVFTNAVFSDAYDELREHGHEPPFDFLIGPSDLAAVEALSDFTPVADRLVQLGQDTATARLDPQEFVGTISHFRVREIRGMPQYYGFGYKSYGTRSQRNPIRIRLEKGQSLPRVIALPDPRAGSGHYPLQDLMLFTAFGVGIGDRTAGTPRYVNSATWTDGTPT